MIDIAEIMQCSPVIPVVAIDDAAHAADLAKALLDGGIRVIEVVRRTPAAADALEIIRREVPEITAGMGTVWTAEQVREANNCGAQFIVSPGISDAVDDACDTADLAYLPGAQTVSELAYIAARGHRAAKIFPATIVGGPSAIKAYASVLPELALCPTGGITADTAADYLALPSVRCVGGSWLAPKTAVAARDWASIREAAANAAALAD